MNSALTSTSSFTFNVVRISARKNIFLIEPFFEYALFTSLQNTFSYKIPNNCICSTDIAFAFWVPTVFIYMQYEERGLWERGEKETWRQRKRDWEMLFHFNLHLWLLAQSSWEKLSVTGIEKTLKMKHTHTSFCSSVLVRMLSIIMQSLALDLPTLTITTACVTLCLTSKPHCNLPPQCQVLALKQLFEEIKNSQNDLTLKSKTSKTQTSLCKATFKVPGIYTHMHFCTSKVIIHIRHS